MTKATLSIKAYTIIILIFIALFFINKNVKKPMLNVSMQESAINYSDQILKNFNLGNGRLISSLLWVQTLIESDIDHYKQKNLNSWMFLRFKTITALDPLFYEAYLYGGKYLSIIKDDDLGAKYIYSKGLTYYSDRYDLVFNSAFHYYFELGDAEKAANLFDKIKFHPRAPKYLPTMTAKLHAKKGDLATSFQIIMATLKKTKNMYMIKKLQDYLYAIRAETDLTCLNQKKLNCNYQDIEKNSYIKELSGKYRAPKNWSPFKIKTK